MFDLTSFDKTGNLLSLSIADIPCLKIFGSFPSYQPIPHSARYSSLTAAHEKMNRFSLKSVRAAQAQVNAFRAGNVQDFL
jgi:hypothetical protein